MELHTVLLSMSLNTALKLVVTTDRILQLCYHGVITVPIKLNERELISISLLLLKKNAKYASLTPCANILQKNKNRTYLWVKQKVRTSFFHLNSQELFLISWREGTE